MKSSEQKKHGYTYKREDLYTCIVFCSSPDGSGFQYKSVLKYHKIAVDKPLALEAFKKFLSAEWPSWKYFNVYGGMSGDYYKRIYL